MRFHQAVSFGKKFQKSFDASGIRNGIPDELDFLLPVFGDLRLHLRRKGPLLKFRVQASFALLFGPTSRQRENSP
jgi:hypothetical protein